MTDLALLACAAHDIPPWAAVAMVAILVAAALVLVLMAR